MELKPHCTIAQSSMDEKMRKGCAFTWLLDRSVRDPRRICGCKPKSINFVAPRGAVSRVALGGDGPQQPPVALASSSDNSHSKGTDMLFQEQAYCPIKFEQGIRQ